MPRHKQRGRGRVIPVPTRAVYFASDGKSFSMERQKGGTASPPLSFRLEQPRAQSISAKFDLVLTVRNGHRTGLKMLGSMGTAYYGDLKDPDTGAKSLLILQLTGRPDELTAKRGLVGVWQGYYPKAKDRYKHLPLLLNHIQNLYG